MMHLKNITAGNPKTKEQYQLTKQFKEGANKFLI